MLGDAQSHRGKKKARAQAKRVKSPIMSSSDEEAHRSQTALAVSCEQPPRSMRSLRPRRS
eukprot:488878-Pleurochrysis_carterae.AAC.1